MLELWCFKREVNSKGNLWSNTGESCINLLYKETWVCCKAYIMWSDIKEESSWQIIVQKMRGNVWAEQIKSEISLKCSKSFIKQGEFSLVKFEVNFFVEKPRKAANFGEIRLHYFCTILYLEFSFGYLENLLLRILLSWIFKRGHEFFALNPTKNLSKSQRLFMENSRVQRTTFDEFRLHYFCTILYFHYLLQNKGRQKDKKCHKSQLPCQMLVGWKHNVSGLWKLVIHNALHGQNANAMFLFSHNNKELENWIFPTPVGKRATTWFLSSRKATELHCLPWSQAVLKNSSLQTITLFFSKEANHS